MAAKNKLSSWLTIILVVSLILIAIAFVIGWNVLKQKHSEEINRVIAAQGGVVQEIERVEREASPFAGDANKSNIIYKITYIKEERKLVAWYRGVNVVNDIHADNPSTLLGGYEEKWLYPSEVK